MSDKMTDTDLVKLYREVAVAGENWDFFVGHVYPELVNSDGEPLNKDDFKGKKASLNVRMAGIRKAMKDRGLVEAQISKLLPKLKIVRAGSNNRDEAVDFLAGLLDEADAE